MALGPLGQWCRDSLPVRGDPTPAAVADRTHRQHQFLDQVVFVTFEAGPWRGGDFQNAVLDTDPGPDFAAPRPVLRRGLAAGGAVAFSMPLGLISGRPFKPFSRAISSRSVTTVCLSSAASPNSRTTSSFNWAGVRPSRSSGGFTHSLNRTPSRRT